MDHGRGAPRDGAARALSDERGEAGAGQRGRGDSGGRGVTSCWRGQAPLREARRPPGVRAPVTTRALKRPVRRTFMPGVDTLPAASPPRTQMPRARWLMVWLCFAALAINYTDRANLAVAAPQHPARSGDRQHHDGVSARVVLLDLRADAAAGGVARRPVWCATGVSDRGGLVVAVHGADVGRPFDHDDVRAAAAAGRAGRREAIRPARAWCRVGCRRRSAGWRRRSSIRGRAWAT